MIELAPHEAIGGALVVPANLAILVSGYLAPLVILVIFGIWGFRLGSKGSNGNPPGGGPKRPEPVPPPPPGGRELDDQWLLADLHVGGFPESPGTEEEAREREHELVAPGR